MRQIIPPHPSFIFSYLFIYFHNFAVVPSVFFSPHQYMLLPDSLLQLLFCEDFHVFLNFDCGQVKDFFFLIYYLFIYFYLFIFLINPDVFFPPDVYFSLFFSEVRLLFCPNLIVVSLKTLLYMTDN